MRVVRFSPQERVDLPDLTAMSFLALGEFRRILRGLVIGPRAATPPTHDNFLIRGFQAEASAVPDALVTVRLIPTGGGPTSFAIGGEDLGARVDFGQLIGGDDSAGNTEGNAQQSFDFTGQPVATYRLQMRFIYSAGVNDNRAFWDAGTNTEFIAAEDTRFLPVYELGISVSPGSLGDEYLPLADVVWNGATVSPGDITDLRAFAHEGTAPYGAATQAAFAAIPDFDRSDDRANDGLNEFYPVLRALARQVADAKGQDGAGNFNWYARAVAPFSDTNSTPFAVEQTKSLRTLETITFTVGDGVTTFGDFNGAGGLEACLQHLEDLGAQMPDAVRVQLHSHDAAGFTWDITTGHNIGTAGDFKYLEIIGEGSSAAVGAVAIDVDAVPAAAVAINMRGVLVLKNLRTAHAVEPANNIIIFASDTMRLKNCQIFGRESDAGSSLSALVITRGGDGSRIVNCNLRGRVFVGPVASGGNTDTTGFLMENTVVENGCVEIDPAATGVDEQTRNLTFRGCDFTMNETHGWGLEGVLDLGNAFRVNIDGCTFAWTHDVDAIHAHRQGSITPAQIRVSKSGFFSGTTAGTHGVGAGGNGGDGTGWGVYLAGDATTPTRGNVVRDCLFQISESIDAGGIHVRFNKAFHISHNTWDLCAHRNIAAHTFDAIHVENLLAEPTMDSSIDHNTISRWIEIAGRYERTAGIVLAGGVEGVSITGNTIDGRGDLEGLITGRSADGSAAAIAIIGSCNFLRVVGNHIQGWEDGVNQATGGSRAINVTTGAVSASVFNSNTFDNCGGFNIDFDLASGLTRVVANGNTFNGADEGINFDASPNRCVANGNTIDTAGSPKIAIDWGAGSTSCICQGNTTDGDIRSTGGVVRGYNHAVGTSDDFNIVVAYV